MANEFWGGFAQTILSERLKDSDAARELDAYKKKQQILLDMQRNEKPDYQAKVWRILDGNGNEIGTRPMTPSEIQDRDLEVRGKEADAKTKEVGAKSAEFKFSLDSKYGETDRQLNQESTRLGMDATRQNISASRSQVGLAQAANSRAQDEFDYNKSQRGNEVETFAAQQLADLSTKLAGRYDTGQGPSNTTIFAEVRTDVQRIIDDPLYTPAQKKAHIQRRIAASIAGLPVLPPPAPRY